MDSPTFESYSAETLALPLPLSAHSEQRPVEAAMATLKHVTMSARGAFELLALKQLEQIAEGGERRRGLTMEVFYTSCREKWIASGMDQLKTFITEFKDHALMSSHHAGGQELVYVSHTEENIRAILAQLTVLMAEEAAAKGKGAPAK